MTVKTFEQPGFLQFLAAIDTDLASRARMQGCRFCGGALRSACYPRKPRGGATEVTTQHSSAVTNADGELPGIGALSRATCLS
jgi:hypothetical protein